MLSFVKRHRVIFVSLFFLIFSVYLVSSPKKGAGGEAIVKRALAGATSPLRRVFLGVRSYSTELFHNYIFLVGVRKNEQALKTVIDSLREENNALKEALAERDRLRELLSFKKDFPIRTVAAKVTGLSELASGWTKTITLDKGSSHGIETDMAVICPEGAVARIIDVRDASSTALLLTDPRSHMDVVIQRTRTKAIASGTGEGMVLKYVKELEDVAPGDKVVTAGVSGIFPKGILVGEVVRVEKRKGGFFKHIEVAPSFEAARLEEALVITERPLYTAE
jgi:rod shape-determining protein MreC